ncbi:MAG TPA: RIP metalloprotease RseP [Chitinispirillaceae bacterium]|nr:RIP metalloprotease RseP [Chitinispirillaceae bacterium]
MISILSIVLGLLVLGILVFIHELGHFLAAKWCGIRVLAFSIGFGNPIIKKTFKGTEYRISSIPFGGYVKMAGENPDEGRAGAPDEFPSRPVWQRAIVAIAGPVANYIIGMLMLWVMFMYGVQQPIYYDRPIIGAVADTSAASDAGLMAGDSLISINNRQIKNWNDIDAAFALQQQHYNITLSRNGQQKELQMTLKKNGDAFPKDLTGGMLPPLPAVVADVSKDSPAEKAGLKTGDTITNINGTTIHSWFQLSQMVSSYKGDDPLVISVARENSVLELSIKPQFNSEVKRYQIGVRVDEGEKRNVSYSPVVAMQKGLDRTWEYTTMIFDVIGKMFAREVPASQLSGPLGIIPASGFMVLQGLSPILQLMALIGIQLAVLNLLPLVITDGGQLLFLIIEAVRRKPVSVNAQIIANKIAIAFFLLLFLFVTFHDIRRLPEMFRFMAK